MFITNESWDFLERHVPDYHTREDVLRLNELQGFVDDQESSVQGITRKEAFLLRDNILTDLLSEAAASFAGKMPLAIPGECSLRDYAEIVAEIAYESGVRGFRPSHDSRETISSVIAWADEFSRLHKDTDWDEVDYPETLLDFVEKKLSTAPHLDDSATAYPIASLTRSKLKKLGYNTETLSDRDVYEIAGLTGDSYVCSNQFTQNIHAACEMFGLKRNSK